MLCGWMLVCVFVCVGLWGVYEGMWEYGCMEIYVGMEMRV